MRILLFTGKGGVGKTTVAAATAARAAEHGLRTIVCSTDPAHSLADAFDVPLGDRPTPIAQRLVRPTAERTGPLRGGLGRRPLVPRRRARLGRRRRGGGGGARGDPRARRGLRPRRHQGVRDVRRLRPRSSSTARRPRRRSGCCRCPTCSVGTWSACSRRSAGSPAWPNPSCNGCRASRSPATPCSGRSGVSTTGSTVYGSC